MAPKPIVIQEQNKIKNDAAVLPAKEKKMVVRRALVDIGNGNAVKQCITRPLTRGYSKSLATAGFSGNNDADMVLKMPLAKAIPRKKVVTKPPVHEIIEISPDTWEKIKVKTVEKSKKRASSKMPAFSSVLTARSKDVTYSMNKKKREEILDVDAGDFENELAVVEYIEEMYRFYKEMEIECQIKDYIETFHPNMNTKMRAILVDWLINVHHKFQLTMETLYLTVNIMDRYFASNPRTDKTEIQLAGIGAMLMASKYEEIWAPEVNDFVSISGKAYTHKQILIMEKRILQRLEWNLTVPTPYVFLVRFIKVSAASSESAKSAFLEENMSYFLAEIGMVNYATVLFYPSMIAAASVYAARSTLNVTPVWNETLKFHTGYSEIQLMNCAKMLIGFRLSPVINFKSVCLKYSIPERGNAALYPASHCFQNVVMR